MSWNEKQKPQRFARYAAMLIMLLTLGAGQMWANYYDVYLDVGSFTGDGGGWSKENATFKVGTSNDASGTPMTQVGDTKWYKASVNFTSGTTVYFCRCNSDGSTNWNSFSINTVSSSNRNFKVIGWGSGEAYSTRIVGNGDGAWISGDYWNKDASSNNISTSITYSSCPIGIKSFRIITGDWNLTHGSDNVASCNVPWWTNEDNNIVFTTIAPSDITITLEGPNVSVHVVSAAHNDTIQKILNGKTIMFYYGTEWGDGNGNRLKYLNKSENHDYYSSMCIHISGDSRHHSVAVVQPNWLYYVSNDYNWIGNQMAANAQAGAKYTNEGNTVNVTAGAAPSFSSSSVSVAKGTINSGLSATCSNSSIGRAQRITYYYTQGADNGSASWTEFNPANVSSMAVGNYTVRALANDSNLYVRSERRLRRPSH